MTAVEPGRKILHKEALRYRWAVSQSLLFTLGAICNFLNLRHIENKRFTINGIYSSAAISVNPYNAIDGIHVFEFDSELANLWIYNRQKGTGGETTLDIKWKSAEGTVWESIFAGAGGVAPKFGAAASNYEACGIGQTKAGFTAPVPVKTQFNAGDMIRMDLLTAMTGTPSGAGIIFHYRPR